jgi:hypothetical protein
LPLRFALAVLIFRPLEFFRPVRALGFLDKIGDSLGRHDTGAPPRAAVRN